MESVKSCKNKTGSRKRPRNESGQGTVSDVSNASVSQHGTDSPSNEHYMRLSLAAPSKEPINKSSSDEQNIDPEKVAAKTEEKPALLEELEEEIERQLEEKAKKTNLTVSNVKHLIKAVITSQDVKTLVDYNLNVSEERPPYEPKLTRAKIKELIAKEFTSAWPLLSPPRKSEMAELINKELPDDSSDEEYNPQDDASDDESKLDESLIEEELNSLQECTVQNLPITQAPLNNIIPDENIGQRTRSKFSLSETPLEAIEQAFIPPDITKDMYSTDCENQDWVEFLKEFMQPLKDTNNIENNDDENDPEYNVMVDEEHEGTDHEELRMDRAVKVTKKELNDLMTEVYEYTQNLSSDDDDSTQDQIIKREIETIDEHANSVLNNMKERAIIVMPLDENDDELYGCERVQEEDVMVKEQVQLLDQQLKQHIQLLTSNILLTYGHPVIDESYCIRFKKMFYYWVSSDAHICGANALMNLQIRSSVDLVNAWNKTMNDPVRSIEIKSFLKKELNTAEEFKTKKLVYRPQLPQSLINLITKSSAFLYPLMLPTCGFLANYPHNSSLSESEANLIVFGIDEYATEIVNAPSSPKGLTEIVNYICANKIPTWSPATVCQFIKRCQTSKQPNAIRTYLEANVLPKLVHYVIPLPAKVVPLYRQPAILLPGKWRECVFQKRPLQNEPSKSSQLS